jgi:hypothetical protein
MLEDEERANIEKMLIEKWKPTKEYLLQYMDEAVVHVDASSASNFNYTDGKITGWKNTGLGNDLFRQEMLYVGNDKNADGTQTGYGSYGYTNGVPAFLMGASGSNIDMAFDRTYLRTVFWVMDIERESSSAWFLGDWWDKVNKLGDTYYFSRGRANKGVKGGYAAHGEASSYFINGTMYCDGEKVNITNDLPKTSTQV